VLGEPRALAQRLQIERREELKLEITTADDSRTHGATSSYSTTSIRWGP